MDTSEVSKLTTQQLGFGLVWMKALNEGVWPFAKLKLDGPYLSGFAESYYNRQFGMESIVHIVICRVKNDGDVEDKDQAIPSNDLMHRRKGIRSSCTNSRIHLTVAFELCHFKEIVWSWVT